MKSRDSCFGSGCFGLLFVIVVVYFFVIYAANKAEEAATAKKTAEAAATKKAAEAAAARKNAEEEAKIKTDQCRVTDQYAVNEKLTVLVEIILSGFW